MMLFDFLQTKGALSREGGEDLAIARAGVTALAGASAPDLASWVTRISRDSLSAIFESNRGPTSMSEHPQFEALSPVPVVCNLTGLVRSLPLRSTLWSLLDLEDEFGALYRKFAKPHCSEPHCELGMRRDADVARDFLSCLYTARVSQPDVFAVVVAACFSQASDSRPIVDEQLRRFRDLGYRRAVLGDRVVRLDEMAAASPAGDRFGIVTTSFGAQKIVSAELEREIEQARALGTPLVAILALSKNGQVLHAKYAAAGYFCPRCGVQLSPAADEPEAGFEPRYVPGAVPVKPQIVHSLSNKSFRQLRRSSLGELADFAAGYGEDGRLLAARLTLCTLAGLSAVPADLPFGKLSSGARFRFAAVIVAASELSETLTLVERPSSILDDAALECLLNVFRTSNDRDSGVLIVDDQPKVHVLCDRVLQLGAQPPECDSLQLDLLKKLKQPKSTEAVRITNASGKCIELPLRRVIALKASSGAGKTRLMRALAGADHDSTLRIEGLGGGLKRRWTEDIYALGWVVEECFVAGKIGVGRTLAEAFAADPSARRAGLTADAFDPASTKGRCPNCAGSGEIRVTLEDVGSVSERCPLCFGRRFSDLVAGVKLRGAISIADAFNKPIAEIQTDLTETLRARLSGALRLGLGQLKLGDALAALSTRERMLLEAAALSSGTESSRSLALLDALFAPFAPCDIVSCIDEFRRFTERGGSVIVSTHDEFALALVDEVVTLPDNFF